MVCVIEHSTLLIFKFHHTDNEGNLPMKGKICLIRTQYKKSTEKKKVKKNDNFDTDPISIPILIAVYFIILVTPILKWRVNSSISFCSYRKGKS